MSETALTTSGRVTLMSDPNRETDIELEIGEQYGTGRSVYAILEYPDDTKENLLARGDKRLFAKAWDKIHTWAAKTGVREGQAFLGPIFRGPYHTAETREPVTMRDKLDELDELYGEAARERIHRDQHERLRPQLEDELARIEQELAPMRAELAALNALIADIDAGIEVSGRLKGFPELSYLREAVKWQETASSQWQK